MNPTDAQIRALFTAQNARHAEVTAVIAGKNLHGYPHNGSNIMEHGQITQLARRVDPDCPEYAQDPVRVYGAMQRALGCAFVDQWIPDNPLTMGDAGYEDKEATATTGASAIVLDGMAIEEPEDVAEHMEKFVFPRLEKRIAEFDREARVREIGLEEYRIQNEIGLDILKTGYDYIQFPCLRYYTYGYENYFCAYAMFPELIDRDFGLQAELARLNNLAAAEAIERYDLPRMFRLDHDMTDSRSTLASLSSMEKYWYPRLEYCLEPVKKVTRLIWHCDGAISTMIPGLIKAGVRGFQGFQYEDGVDIEKLFRTRDAEGEPLVIWAGVSVTRTLPFGTPEDVRNEIDGFVRNHGDAGLILACSSSVTPGVPPENLDAMAERFHYYKEHLK